jgi:hypothetical protein
VPRLLVIDLRCGLERAAPAALWGGEFFQGGEAASTKRHRGFLPMPFRLFGSEEQERRDGLFRVAASRADNARFAGMIRLDERLDQQWPADRESLQQLFRRKGYLASIGEVFRR